MRRVERGGPWEGECSHMVYYDPDFWKEKRVFHGATGVSQGVVTSINFLQPKKKSKVKHGSHSL